MERSLTVLLPVHNVQTTLAGMVLEILEVVSELTERFELVIVDDGSTDATSEVAHELTRDYPQVRALRHGKRLGREAAIRAGLRHSSGEMILVREERCEMPIDGVAKLWRVAGESQWAVDHAQRPAGCNFSRLNGARPPRHTGYQMLDRGTMERVHGSSRPSRPNYLARLKEFALGE